MSQIFFALWSPFLLAALCLVKAVLRPNNADSEATAIVVTHYVSLILMGLTAGIAILVAARLIFG